MQIDLTGIASLVAVTFFGVALRVGYALIERYVKNAAMRSLLETTLGNALGMMQQATQADIVSAKALHPTVDNPLVAVGVKYALDHADEAVSHFDLTSDALAEKIEARIGVANIKTNLAVAGSALPVAPKPLDPVPVFPPGSVTTAELNQASAAAGG